MAAVPITKPLEKLKKIRSWDEFRTRGGQAFAAYIEQKYNPHIPTDEEFVALIDAAQFGRSPIIAESLWQRFYNHGKKCFFPAFRRPNASKAAFETEFPVSAKRFITAAEEILRGRVDLLGFKGLYVGTDIDWHREPISTKRSPLKHWKEFDELDTTETGDKKVLWELNRHQHFFTLGVAYMLTKDERFADEFVSQLSSWMEQNPPAIGINWASSLEVAFRAMSWIWAFHFFRDSNNFTPELFKTALKYLYVHGRHIEQYLSKYYSPNTHLTGEALALYYLGTQLRYFKRADHWRKLGEDILFSEITRQVHPDGVYFEQSTWYQRYTCDFYAHFSILRSLDAEAEFDLREQEMEECLKAAFDHLMYLQMPDGTTPLIGDDDGGRLLPMTAKLPDDFRGTLSVGSVLFDSPELKYVAGGASEEIFWLIGPSGLDTYRAHPSHESSATSIAFSEGGYSVMRDGWENTDNVLIVDCGEVGALAGGHGHADALSVGVAIHGRTTLVDPGTYTYHESREMRDFFRTTAAHNTLTIDGLSSSEPGTTFGWRTRAECTLNRWIADERFDLFKGSHDGYRRLADPVTHERSIFFLKNDYWIIRDVATAIEAHEYSLNFHFAENIRPAIGDSGAWIGDEHHRIFTFGDNGAWEQKESWVSRSHGNKRNATFMRFISKATGTQEFFTFILPADIGQDQPEVAEVASPTGRAFAIKYNGYTDLFVFNDEPGTTIDTGLFQTGFGYTWARMRDGETLPDEIVAIDGNTLSIKGSNILGSQCDGHASARRLGNEFYIKTAADRFTRSLPSK